MADDSAEKQYEPSSKRLDDLKKKGQVLRSRDFSGGLLILVSVLTLSSLCSFFHSQFRHNFIDSFSGISNILSQQDFFIGIINKLVIKNFILLMPLFIMVLLSVFVSVFMFGGWNFTLQAVAINFEKMNPATNLANIFSKRTVIEVFKSMLKFILIFGMVFYFFKNHLNELMRLDSLQVKSAIFVSYELVFSFVWSLLIALIFIVAADMVHQHNEYVGKNKMSYQEMRDENKETDGNPENKRRQKSAQFALVRQRLSMIVPKADVIVTNPTHYAIALSYVDGKDRAPRVIAKGKDNIASQIRSIGSSHGITIYPAPPLARAIYYTTKIGGDIHPDLYMAVAVVLSYVYQLKNYQQGVGALPEVTSEFSIPEKFVFND